MVLKDLVDDMDMVEDAEHDRGFLGGQAVEIPADHIVEAAIGPALDINELGVRLTGHVKRPFLVRSRRTMMSVHPSPPGIEYER